MATVVLTAVGTALGGPVGAAIGGLIGNLADHAVLFRPRGREGARLSDLQVQTSSYGTQVPRLFGTMRVAGTVIWATDLRETKSRTGGGKGRPSVTTYDYSASFAVALSARRIVRVKRIWADGNLLRGAAGDFKTELGAFRVHGGGEDQAVDPLIAAAQGTGVAPAHRGIAYAVFEDLALADYGNRIPSLTFEVEADEGLVDIGTIARDLTQGRMDGASLGRVGGYAAGGADVREALAPLVESHGLALDGLTLSKAGDVAADIGEDRLARRVNGRSVDSIERTGNGADAAPFALSVRYHDVARDYQAGVQRVTRPGAGRGEAGFDLPAVLTADVARALAAERLGAAWTGRSTMTLRCGWAMLAVRPGSVVRVYGVPGLWRVEEREWEAMAVRLALRRIAGRGALPGSASPGAVVRQDDAVHGPTTLMIADLPWVKDGVADAPLIVAAASGGAGWQRASLFVMDAGGDALPAGRAGLRATLGSAMTVLPPASMTMIDERHGVEVVLIADDMSLMPADDDALAQGRNLCLIGDELVQFARAERIEAGRYRLSRLYRGLRGTEWAMETHHAGEPFLLIEEDRLAAPLGVVGSVPDVSTRVEVAAVGLGDIVPARATLTVRGEALMPPSPVHLRWRNDGAGGVIVDWTRRSRDGWRWANGRDVPLGEESERYRVDLIAGGVTVRSDEVSVPQWHGDAAAIGTASPWTVEVRQIGTHATGRPARITWAD